jgi:hypothetical protein
MKKQSEAVLKALSDSGARQDIARQLWLLMCEADNGALFPVDLMANGAIKRSVSQASALRQLVGSWNLLCARALLTLQIDTALRLSVRWSTNLLTSQPQFCEATDWTKSKDRDGNQMREAYLIDKLPSEHNWWLCQLGLAHFDGLIWPPRYFLAGAGRSVARRAVRRPEPALHCAQISPFLFGVFMSFALIYIQP